MKPKKKLYSALLELLNKRKAWDLPEYKRPWVDRKRLDEAIRLQSQADASDPWAGARMRLYILNGYELASDVYREAKSHLSINGRDEAKVNGKQHGGGQFDRLEPLKKQVDMDRAWNQHYDQEWKEEHKR